ncbi:hypothetical protein LguiB_012797 [Lonicera macranthoides]
MNGSIPLEELANLKNLSTMDLGRNLFSGPNSSSIGFLTQLTRLYLDGNRFTESVPSKFENLKNLEYLYHGSNTFSGPIPSSICVLTNLTALDLSHNQLTGFIPAEIQNLKILEYLYLDNNNFSGAIPSSIYALTDLTKLELYRNRLTEFIPSEIRNLKNLISLRLEWNNLSCVSNNKARNMCSIWNYDGTIAYEDIIRSTNDFDIKHCIGIGGYGIVSRAQLLNGKVVALKKLHSFEAEEPTFDKSFKNEVEILSNIRHKNIVKLYGFYLHNRCMFLVYE